MATKIEYTEMTPAAAIAAGYTSYGIDGETEQSLKPLEDLLDDEEFDSQTRYNGVLCVADTTPHTYSFSAQALYEMIENDVYGQELSADPEALVDDIKEIDFEPLAKQLNDLAAKHPFYYLTKIKLVKEKSIGLEPQS